MGSELFVALCFVSLLHLVKRFANERTTRLEHPLTLRASEALKTLDLNPDQLAWHGRILSQNGQSETGQTVTLTGVNSWFVGKPAK
jgi:hypothetical protein